MNTKVATERTGGVLVITINNPPINAGSIEVRKGLLQAVDVLAQDPALRAGVLIGGGTTFMAGSDLKEFGKPLEDPQLPAVIAAIERCPKPVVAALHGAALGGGFELALGCDARVASREALVGLPEATLGMIPGAGGTQRLPRIVGLTRALHMVCSGERVKAPAAHSVGIVDAVFDADLRSSAIQFAQNLSAKRRLRDAVVPAEPESLVQQQVHSLQQNAALRPNIQTAIDMVLAARSVPIDDALRQEREGFQRYRMSDEAAALRHLFFAERELARSKVDDATLNAWAQHLMRALHDSANALIAQGASASDVQHGLRAMGALDTNLLAPQGIAAAAMDADMAVQRALWLALVASTARMLAEHGVARAADLDVALTRCAGFSRWLGGPVFWSRQQDPERLRAELRDLVPAASLTLLLALPPT